MDSGQFRASNQAAALDLLRRFDEIFAVLEPTVAAGGLSDAQVDERVASAIAPRRPGISPSPIPFATSCWNKV